MVLNLLRRKTKFTLKPKTLADVCRPTSKLKKNFQCPHRKRRSPSRGLITIEVTWRLIRLTTILNYAGSETRNQIYIHVLQIVNDRDRLQTELHYAESTIYELDAQNRELHRLLKSVQDALQSSDDRVPTQIHPRNLDLSHKANWIGGTWLSCAKTAPLLTAAEAAWQGGKSQQALALVAPILNEEDLKPSHRINAGLLYSAILRGNGDLEGALHYADECLSIAKETEQRQLTGKAQFHRGLCCLYLDRYADARWCFVLASHTEGHVAIVQEYLTMTQQNLTRLEVDDPRAKVSL